MTEAKAMFDEGAEAALLGSVLMEGARVLPMVRGALRLEEDAFYVPAHRLIWQAIVELDDAGTVVDAVTVSARLFHAGTMDLVGGQKFVDTLLENTPTAAHAEHYAQIVREKWLGRRVVAFGEKIARQVVSTEDVEAFVGGLPAMAGEVGIGAPPRVSNRDLANSLVAEWREAHRVKGPTWKVGLPWRTDHDGSKGHSLDVLLGGLEPGLTLVAARPSVGKTTFECQVSQYVARELGGNVARITMDMTARRVLQRTICERAGVSAAKLKAGYAYDSDMAAVEAAIEEMSKDGTMDRFLITDQETDVHVMTSWLRSLHLRTPLALFTMDFVQLAGVSNAPRVDANTRIGMVTRAFKTFSNTTGIPCMALSQLRRSDGGRPKLEDLRDSGNLEQDAAKVLFLYMDDATHKRMEEAFPGVTAKLRPVWAEVMKNQDGETGRRPMWLHAQYFRFTPAPYQQGGFEDWEEQAEMYVKSVRQEPRRGKAAGSAAGVLTDDEYGDLEFEQG